jgi:DNA helicase-2/ATP-dependent DNA helicase PcrA
MFQPRPSQKKVLEYSRGRMGIVAVPGSGKTQILSLLAAQIITSGLLDQDQEVLVVTLVNSAVDEFARRMGTLIERRSLIPNFGYRVRTLHGLAHDIVRERPDLVGLSEDFQIIDEHDANQIRQDAAQAWLNAHPNALDDYLDPDLLENSQKLQQVRRYDLPQLVNEMAVAFIRTAKDLRLSPALLRRHLEQSSVPLPLVEMGCAIYADYQRALTYRGAVDFDDLVWLAIQVLEMDVQVLERLRRRWPFILEDEAQDSSRLQEQILRLLCGPKGNWVRVGDPNQAIYETFTTANPRFLMNFLHERGVKRRRLPESGRSTRSIIKLANYLIDWTRRQHPNPDVRHALSLPHIKPTSSDDPQPNPPDDPRKIWLFPAKYSPVEEVQVVVRSLERWLPQHTQETVAVLVPRNLRGAEVIEELARRGIPYYEALQSTLSTRLTTATLNKVMDYLAAPQTPSKLGEAYKAWRFSDPNSSENQDLIHRVAVLLRKCRFIEDFTSPLLERDWLNSLSTEEENATVLQELEIFRQVVQRWQEAVLLPIDQLILTIAQDLFTKPVDLALAHKLALMLRHASNLHTDWRLPELNREIGLIARNERRFLGFSEDDTGFDPERHKGKVIVATIHKAKGLEFDRVYLMSVNNYDFPSGVEGDQYISEPWFIRNRLNLTEEALEQLRAALSPNEYTWYREGEATRRARLNYVAERLRLLYVGITRAKKELIITWNSGRHGNLRPALPFLALQTYWETRTASKRIRSKPIPDEPLHGELP